MGHHCFDYGVVEQSYQEDWKEVIEDIGKQQEGSLIEFLVKHMLYNKAQQ